MPSKPTNTKTGKNLTTAVGAMIPLAIALAHGALTGAAPQQNPASAPPTPHPTAMLGIAQCGGGTPDSPPCQAPYPMLTKGHPVAWWFVFKFNASAFPGCGSSATRACPFGGSPQAYSSFGQQFAYASSDAPTLQQGDGCTGDTTSDPVGATFDEVYNGAFHYVIWNDQFYDDPAIQGCSQECGSPWGHSKGMVAWNDAGEGLVMQVSTPSWPAAGSPKFPRKSDGNTLGCVKDNDVQVSQHFFALRLNKDDLVSVLQGLSNASVVTDPGNSQIVSNGGPPDVQQLVSKLGVKSSSTTYTSTTLSTGVQLISKPSSLHVPPWQMVSAVLGGVSLRTATWWASPEIYSTDATTPVSCWSPSLKTPGAVQIATTGTWGGKTFGLTGGLGTNFNHAKLGVSTSGASQYAIFGDMNQQGALSGTDCSSSQNGRGGLFYVLIDPQLSASLSSLMNGDTAPTAPPAK
jgi:hypothetical protein